MRFFMPALALPISAGDLLIHALDVRLDVVGFLVQLFDERALLSGETERQGGIEVVGGGLRFLLEDVLEFCPAAGDEAKNLEYLLIIQHWRPM